MLPSPLRRIEAIRNGIRSLSSTPPSSPKVIFSGIQPTGIPHLGNYLGALRQWVKLQDEAKPNDRCYFSIVDLHAITIPQEPGSLKRWRKEMFASLLAIGLDAKKSTIFYQSDVPQHSELMWILSCRASMGYLSRMTQWKSKVKLTETASPYDTPSPLGLFSYPVLQAADILLYRTTHVPVGEDQAQHLEFTRNIAAGFNSHYGPTLIEPETLLSPAKRVMSLTQPTKKMSKSDQNPKSSILITDNHDAIVSKISGAVTDSEDGITYDRESRPGWSNLIEIMYHLDGGNKYASCEEVAHDWNGMSKKAAKFVVASSIDTHLAPIREKYHELTDKDSRHSSPIVESTLEGASKATMVAATTMEEVRKAVGLWT